MLLSMRQYAKRRGVTVQAISQAVKAGRITLGPENKIDPEIADAQLGDVRSPAGLPAIGESKQAQAAYDALSAKLDYERKVGNLIPITEAVLAGAQMAQLTRQRMMAIPATIAPRVTASTDVAEVRKILEHEIASQLEHLSRDFLAAAGEGAPGGGRVGAAPAAAGRH